MSILAETTDKVASCVLESTRRVEAFKHRFSTTELDKNAAELSLDKDFDASDPDSWVKKIKDMDHKIYFNAKNIADSKYAWYEISTQFLDTIHEIYKAFDIMGRFIETLCEEADISFEQLLERWHNKHNELGERPLPPKENSTQGSVSEEETTTVSKEPRKVNKLPF